MAGGMPPGAALMGRPPSRQSTAWRGIAWRLAMAIAALGVIWGGVWAQLERDRAHELADMRAKAANLARLVDMLTVRLLDSVDQTLLVTRALYARERDRFDMAAWGRQRTILNDLSIQLAIADVNGMIAQSNLGPTTGPVSIADREHFLVHTRDAGDRTYISAPILGRVSGRVTVQASRPIRDISGAFIGVVIASLDAEVLGRFFAPIEIGRGFIQLVGLDGVARAGRGGATPLPPPPDPTLMARLRDSPVGSFHPDGAGEDGPLISYRRLARHPLVVTVGVDPADGLADYRRESRHVIRVGGVLSAMIVLVSAVVIVNRRRLVRSQTALTVTLENMSQGILMVDRNRRVPVINQRAADLLGLPGSLARPGVHFDEILKWQIGQQEFAPSNDGGAMVGLLASRGGLDAGLPAYERERPDGTVLDVRTALLPGGGAVRTYADITERKRFERDLAVARDAAEAAGRVRTDFLRVISHEIRTPLNGILGIVDLQLGLRLDPEQERYARIIHDAGEHLLMLVEDILDFSSLDSYRVSLAEAPFSLPDLVASTIALLQPEARAKGLSLTASLAPGLPDALSGDRERVRQILVNLIGNALKFTERGGVTVTVALLGDDGARRQIGFTVSDTGIGIPPHKQPTLFEAFTQGDGSIGRRFGGTGLGLAVCKELVTLMDGAITVDSQEAAGSTFRFDIWLKPADPVAVAPAGKPAPAAGPGALHVLLADDNATNRLVATRMIAAMGHTVDAVADGAAAIAAIGRQRYDAVLMDMMMPEIDGLAATRAIRAGPAPGNATPILGLTANSSAQGEAACRAAGMDGFMTKPVRRERLAEALAAVARHPAAGAGPILDAAVLVALDGAIGADGVRDAMALFLEDAPPHGVMLRRGFAAGDSATVRRGAHALAGVAAAIGLTRLSEAARHLQHITETVEPEAAEIDTLLRLLEEAERAVRDWLAARPAPAIG